MSKGKSVYTYFEWPLSKAGWKSYSHREGWNKKELYKWRIMVHTFGQSLLKRISLDYTHEVLVWRMEKIEIGRDVTTLLTFSSAQMAEVGVLDRQQKLLDASPPFQHWKGIGGVGFRLSMIIQQPILLKYTDAIKIIQSCSIKVIHQHASMFSLVSWSICNAMPIPPLLLYTLFLPSLSLCFDHNEDGDVRNWNWRGTPLPANHTLQKPRLLKVIQSLNNTHEHLPS